MRLASALALTLLTATGARALDDGAQPAFPNGISGTELHRIVSQAMQAQGLAGSPEIAAKRSFPPCNHVPEMRPANGNRSLLRLSCNAPRPWTRHLRNTAGSPRYVPGNDAKPQMDGPEVVKLARSLKRGAVITRADIELAPSGGSAGLGAFTDPSDVVGRKLTANVGEGRVLQARQLEQNWLITRNIPVEIGFQTNSVSVSMPGIALENGQLGQMIDVKNSSSGRVLKAIVAGPQKVQINAKTH